jgi:predicted nucleic acid-binding protein
MARVIADSSALIGLQRIDRLDLLQQLFGEVLVPPAVVREVTYKLPELPAWVRAQQLTRSLPPEVIERRLGPGESEAIALAFELDIKRVIIDDLRARVLASRLGLQAVGTGALLYLAKTRGIIPAVRPLLDAMLAKGFRLSPKVYADLLRAAGEEGEL